MKIDATKSASMLRVGLFGIGLDTYWDQFAGLKGRLEGYTRLVADRMGQPGVQVINLGLIDTVDKAFEAGDSFRRAGVDILFLHVTTYALSATVMPVLRRAKVPVIVLNLAPEPAMDYRAAKPVLSPKLRTFWVALAFLLWRSLASCTMIQ